ncbi:MAG TPA: SigE family RNA polymerase sigma factor [Streptosporangiaceae bacterium]|nr:SigE family RNA polymerase sigma factor [Streptosporangiaceae bacterium]
MGITEMHHEEARLLHAAPASAGPAALPLTAADHVTALYRAHGMDLVRVAAVMLGSRASGEDAVHDAFCAVFRRWDRLADSGKALAYVRAAVLNQCRSELRRQARLERRADRHHRPLDAQSPEQAAILGEEHRDVLAALRRLPDRQREALILRYFLDMPDSEIAVAMGISHGTVKSTVSRATTALGKLLKEHS